MLEEEEITDEKLLAEVGRVYDNRESYIEAMKKSNQSEAVVNILKLIANI